MDFLETKYQFIIIIWLSNQRENGEVWSTSRAHIPIIAPLL